MRALTRLLALAVVLAAVGLAVGPDARASVSVTVTFEGLVRASTAAGVMTPVEQHAVWENGRIVTYTRVHVDEAIAGDLPTGGEAWVASLGGVIGNVGQTVDGEPPLHVGRPALLFLRPDRAPSVRVVTARAQGYFGIRVDPATHVRTFHPSNAVGELLPVQRGLSATAPRTAAEVVADRASDDVAREIATAWRTLHAP
jgi:hypothetical protein